MSKIDLIIDALENSEPKSIGHVHVREQKHQAALAAARELKALKPVGEFKRDQHGAWYEVPGGTYGRKFYRLDKVTK
jgi:hypothetical protein